MVIKGLVETDFCNYKKASMFIIFPKCSWKCEKECGRAICQNSSLAHSQEYEVPIETIVQKYLNNPITKAIVCGGLEPFDSYKNLTELIKKLREKTEDDIVIYTGYKEEEIFPQIQQIIKYKNIIIKFGRFLPDQKKHYDEILGVNLASKKQYAKRYE